MANREGQLRPGMFARVRLFLDATHESLVIPEQALVPQGDDHYVYKVVENQARRTKVSIGQRRDGKVEIQQGLAKGDVVVTAGQIRLRDGAPVEVAQAGPAPVPEAGKPEAKPAPAGGRS